MQLTRRLPLHRLCARKAQAGAYTHPVFTGTHLLASNGIAACWQDVEDSASDFPGYVPKRLTRWLYDADGEVDHGEIRVLKDAVRGLTFAGDVEAERFDAQPPKLKDPASDFPAPPKPMRGKGVVRLAISATHLHHLAIAMGTAGKDQAVVLEMRVEDDGQVARPVRVVPFDNDHADVVGLIAPFVPPVEQEAETSTPTSTNDNA